LFIPEISFVLAFYSYFTNCYNFLMIEQQPPATLKHGLPPKKGLTQLIDQNLLTNLAPLQGGWGTDRA
jgi:hypothetical protein